METPSSSSPTDSLLERLVKAKLAGWKQDGNGYYFRNNEQAAEAALRALEEWLLEHCDPDQLVIETAINWYDALEKLGHYSAECRAAAWSRLRSDRWPAELALAAAVERLKGYA